MAVQQQLGISQEEFQTLTFKTAARKDYVPCFYPEFLHPVGWKIWSWTAILRNGLYSIKTQLILQYSKDDDAATLSCGAIYWLAGNFAWAALKGLPWPYPSKRGIVFPVTGKRLLKMFICTYGYLSMSSMLAYSSLACKNFHEVILLMLLIQRFHRRRIRIVSTDRELQENVLFTSFLFFVPFL